MAARLSRSEFRAGCAKLLHRAACDNRLTSAEARLAILLFNTYANHEFGYGWPSRHTLAHDLGVNPTTVTRAWASLERYGYIAVQRNRGRGHTNRYFPLFEDQEKGEALHPFRGRVGGDEKGEAKSIKGCSPRTEKGEALHQDPSTEPSTKASTDVAALASPPDGGSRRTSCKQEHTGDADDDGDNQPPSAKPPKLSTALNRNRAPVKTPAYWTERARSKKAEEMEPKERERFWREQLEDAKPSSRPVRSPAEVSDPPVSDAPIKKARARRGQSRG